MRNLRLLENIVFVCLLSTTITSSAQTFTVLKNMYGATGTYSAAPLVQNRVGNLAGSAEQKGAYDAGTLFVINPTGKFLGILSLNGTDGSGSSDLVLGSDGNFYGTNVQGGGGYQGDIFKINSSGTLTVIYKFTGGSDGGYPTGGLTEATDGNFYGVTQLGGDNGSGTIYKITPSGRLTTIFGFSDPNAEPSGLTLGNDGNFYGTADDQMYQVYGQVFRITPNGEFTTLYKFTDINQVPALGLTLGNDGNFYGTIPYGGTNNAGSIYRVTRDGVFSIFYAFSGADGASAYTPPIVGNDGNFYGVTYGGGANGVGTIYKLTPNGVLTTLHSFDGTDGSGPYFLLQHTNGSLYGTTPSGGLYGEGTIYSMTTGVSPFVKSVTNFGSVGSTVQFIGQSLTGTTAVSFNGTPASFKVVSDTFMTAVVPSGATSGFVTVTTPGGDLKSNVPFRVLP
jgi:uncharacterized repeat protein (TIGR03803 family)